MSARETAPLVPCGKCGGLRFDFGGPHAPRFQGGVLVDCTGQAIVGTASGPRALEPLPGFEPQPEQLERVSERIGSAIVGFCRSRVGQTFHADELRQNVTACVGAVAPESANRVLRDLRKRGAVAYEVVNRAKSLYRVHQ